MTSKEKSIELVNKFRISKAITEQYAKQCSLITVNEILLNFGIEDGWTYEFWQEVKKEIEKL
jgi:hypothetical protein